MIITLIFPNGTRILAEVARTPAEKSRGLMFRNALEPCRGMLFVYETMGLYSFWMHQVRIPLDMIWMDLDQRIVEIVSNARPCDVLPCPRYGGDEAAAFVLEVAGGMAVGNGLKVGDRVEFAQ